jgi:hypothetical protein
MNTKSQTGIAALTLVLTLAVGRSGTENIKTRASPSRIGR